MFYPLPRSVIQNFGGSQTFLTSNKYSLRKRDREQIKESKLSTSYWWCDDDLNQNDESESNESETCHSEDQTTRFLTFKRSTPAKESDRKSCRKRPGERQGGSDLKSKKKKVSTEMESPTKSKLVKKKERSTVSEEPRPAVSKKKEEVKAKLSRKVVSSSMEKGTAWSAVYVHVAVLKTNKSSTPHLLQIGKPNIQGIQWI